MTTSLTAENFTDADVDKLHRGEGTAGELPRSGRSAPRAGCGLPETEMPSMRSSARKR